MASRLIRNERYDPQASLINRRQVVRAAVARSKEFKVLTPYFPRPPAPIPGDPAGDGGQLVAESELTVDLRNKINAIAASNAVQGCDFFGASAFGQTDFGMTKAPIITLPLLMVVNNIEYSLAGGFVSVPATLVVRWLNVPFSLDTLDRVEVRYYFVP